MAFKATTKTGSADPVLMEIHDETGEAVFDDGTVLTFPPGCKYLPNNSGDKLGNKIMTPSGKSAVVIQGATIGSVRNTIAQLQG